MLIFLMAKIVKVFSRRGIYKAKVHFFTKVHHLHNQNSSIYVLVVCCLNVQLKNTHMDPVVLFSVAKIILIFGIYQIFLYVV